MHIIPVIDLRSGQVVHAVGGDRRHYRPVVSALCHSAEPGTVARLLCEHCATDTLYVADLDALQGGPVQVEVLARLLRADRQRRLWLDAGFADLRSATEALLPLGVDAARVRPVFGTESLRSRGALAEIRAALPGAVLSLDSRGAPLDAAGIWAAPELWPATVIAMGIARVGSGAGPDLAQLAALRSRAPQAQWIGSGGIRDEADLQAAGAAGAHAWLVATALHEGRLPKRPSSPNAATTCDSDEAAAGHTLSRAVRCDGAASKPPPARDDTHPVA